MTTPEDDSIDSSRPRIEHPRPVRFTREVLLPLAVRKEPRLAQHVAQRR